MQQEIPRARDITKIKKFAHSLTTKKKKDFKVKFTLSHSNLEILHSCFNTMCIRIKNIMIS